MSIAAGIAKRNENNEIFGAFKNRLLFPIKNQAKRVVGFIGVSLNENIEMKGFLEKRIVKKIII